MTVFSDLELRWKGQGHVIPEAQVTKACAIVEDVITFQELMGFFARGATPFAKVSMAYAALLRFAGAQVTDNEVFGRMFDPGDNMQRDASVLVQYLLERMLPKELEAGGSAKPGNA